jgi:hypothetical protein
MVYGSRLGGFRVWGSGFRVGDQGVGYLKKENSNSHGARPVYQNHLDKCMDSDQ